MFEIERVSCTWVYHVHFEYSLLILVQRISPETSSKVQLQIVLHNDTSSNFHFANPKGRAAQVKERDEVKDMLAQLIPVHRQKMNKDLEEKNK